MDDSLLSDDELSLMSDSERPAYENGIKRQKLMNAFVEHIVELDKATIEKQKPRLKQIVTIDKLDIRKFKRPDIVVTKRKPFVRPEAPKSDFELPDFAKIVFPQQPKLSSSELRFAGIPKFEAPKLCQVPIPKPTTKKFEPKEVTRKALPTVKVPALEISAIEKRLKKGRKIELSKKPEVALPKLELKQYVAPVPNRIALNKVTISKPSLVRFTEPVKAKLVFPKIAKPEVTNKGFVMPNISKPSFAAVKVPKLDIKKFEMPKIERSKSSVKVDIAALNINAFVKPELAVTKAVKVKVPQAKVKSFVQPDVTISQQPKVTVAQAPDASWALEKFQMALKKDCGSL